MGRARESFTFQAENCDDGEHCPAELQQGNVRGPVFATTVPGSVRQQ